MINLIPAEERKRMKTNFYYRLVVLFFVVFDFSLLVLSISVVPSYILSSIKSSGAQAKLELQQKEPLPIADQETLSVTKSINDKLSLVEKAEKNKFLISEKVINTILLKKRSDVKIMNISYQSGATGRKISITGTAPSREVLLLFRQALEDDAAFKNVDLPISNFVKGSNIQFNLNLTPA